MASFPMHQRIQRIAGELRFKPKLSSWANVVEAAKQMEGSYPHWQIPKGKQGDIALISDDEKKILRIKYDTIIYTNETSRGSTDELTRHLTKVFKKLIQESGVTEMRHIGCRSTTIFGLEFKYSEIVQIMYEKFYRQDGPLREISANKNIDTAFILDGEKNGIKNHVRIGPMSKEEALSNFNSNFDIDTSDFKEEAYLFFDIDTYIGESHSSTALEKLEQVVSANKEILEGYKNYISG